MRVLAAVGFGLVVAAAAVPAAAQPFYGGFRPYAQAQRQGQDQRPQRGAGQPVPQRDTRSPPEPDRGRMSPDERRQLRRDIQDAGRDIYRPARSMPAPGRSGRGGRR